MPDICGDPWPEIRDISLRPPHAASETVSFLSAGLKLVHTLILQTFGDIIRLFRAF